MPDYVTDTHGLIWYLEDSPRLGAQARMCFEKCDQGQCNIHVPTICLVEIIYLQEKGRISFDMKVQLDAELMTGSSGLVLADLTPSVANLIPQISRAHVPDMPDRIIAATALCLDLALITRDAKIKISGVKTVW